MSKSTISTFELFQMFPDNDSGRLYFEARRWPDGAACPACGEHERIGTRKGGFYRCNACLLDFTVRTNTIFKRSKVPLHKWLAALVIVADRPDIASYDLGEELGLTQKTGWLMLKRLHRALGPVFEANMGDSEDRRATPLHQQGFDRMTEKIRSILDAVTERVFAYRPNGE